MTDSTTVWDNCLRTIKRNVNTQSYRTWFEPIKPVALDGSSLTIQVPNKFFYEWLEENYVSLLKTTIRQELGERGRLEYQILNGSSQGNSNNVPRNNPNSAQHTPSVSRQNSENSGNNESVDTNNIKNPFVIPGIRRIKVDPQLNVNYTFDNYIEGDCNRLARSAGMAVAKKPGGTAFNPLFMFGGVGLGKTDRKSTRLNSSHRR